MINESVALVLDSDGHCAINNNLSASEAIPLSAIFRVASLKGRGDDRALQRKNTRNVGCESVSLGEFCKSCSLIDCISVGVDRMQRNFEPMLKQVEAWQKN